MIALPVYNTEGKVVDNVKLDPHIFDGKVNTAAIYQAVCAYRACQRKGLASTKTRGEVSGGGRKPWRQKGTGRSRVGSIRSPLWRGGGVVFGPHPRDFSYHIPKKLKLLALKSALCAKLNESNILVLDNFGVEKTKTKEAAKIFSHLKIKPLKNLLLLLDKMDDNLKLVLRNIDFLEVNLAKNTHAYEIMKHRKLIITKDALSGLTARLKN